MQLNVIVVSCKLLISPEAEHTAFEESPKVAAQHIAHYAPPPPSQKHRPREQSKGGKKK